MRALAIAFLLLAACDRNSGQGDTAADARPVALTYDGADYKTDAQKIAHGERLATILDCTGCHGGGLQGMNATKEEPELGEIYAPNVTLLLDKYTDADFERLIRHGRPKDGREFWFMPVESYQFLSDPDVNAIIAYIRSLAPTGEQLPPIRKGPQFEKDVANGIFGNAQVQIAKYRKDQPVDMGPQYARGRYLTQTTCTACHNSALQGWENFTPDLDIAGTYSKAELTHLLATGEGKKPKLGMMAAVARMHFAKMTPGEREAIVDYILARANRPRQPQ